MGFDCNVNLRTLVSNIDLLKVCAVMNVIRVFVDLGLIKVLKLIYCWFEFDLREKSVDFGEL